MRLGEVMGGLAESAAQQVVTGFAIDHRNIAPGNIFGAFRGARFNAETVIAQAVAAGAIAVVASAEAEVHGAVHIVADEPRRRFAELAARFFQPVPGHIVAVTGTNGKTSIAEMTRQLWAMAGHRSASIGTLGITTAQDQVRTGLTTPDIVVFLSNMTGLAREGVSHVAFEASSHGLDQYRSEGLPVMAGAFTNLSRDHLDYHGDMERYFAAKMRLFDEVVGDGGAAIIWADGDSWAQRASDHARRRGLRIISVGPQGETIRLVAREPTSLGQKLTVEVADEAHHFALPLIGAYQAANCLCAAGLVLASGGSWAQLLDHLPRLQPVRGRLERAVISREGAPVYVDYAHTPDGLKAAIDALRPHVTGRLITIFGAGGDRDRGKRPEMGAIAAQFSDHVIVTDDNPRSEDPASIRAAILTAAPQAEDIGERREAIARGIALARSGDIILLAGKGHEQGQIIGERVIPFDDVSVARECAA